MMIILLLWDAIVSKTFFPFTAVIFDMLLAVIKPL